MELKIGKKNYKLRFGYKAVAKSGIIKEAMRVENLADTDDYGSMIEVMLDVVAKMVLAGLQKTDAFSTDYDSETDVKEKMEKVYDLLDDYLEQEDSLSITDLFQKLMGEMFEAGFFGKKSAKMEQIAQEVDATVIPIDHKS